MSNLSNQQRQLVCDFKDTTSSSEKQAIQYLTKTKWNLQIAINNFFDEGAIPEKQKISYTKQLQNLFVQLSSLSEKNNTRYMNQDQFAQFCQKYMQLDLEDILLGYILTNVMGVETSGYIQFKHFMKIFQYLLVDNPYQLKANLQKLRNELEINNKYYEMYLKLYKLYLFGKNKQGSLSYQIGIQLWKLYLKPKLNISYYNYFVQYIDSQVGRITKIHHDLWKMVYQFATNVKNIYEVKQSDAWPVFIDNFVQFVKLKQNKINN